MIIDGYTIKRALDEGTWKAYRNNSKIGSADLKIGANSVDITLGSKMLIPCLNDDVIDVVDYEKNLEWVDKPEYKPGKFLMLPGTFALAAAQERFDVSASIKVDMSDGCDKDGFVPEGFEIGVKHQRKAIPKSMQLLVAPMFEGRSTMARLGLAMHVTAGFGDYGFDGHFTMELVNHGPLALVLTVGMRIAQLSFQVVTPDAVKVKYSGAYSKKVGGPVAPVLGRDRFMSCEE